MQAALRKRRSPQSSAAWWREGCCASSAAGRSGPPAPLLSISRDGLVWTKLSTDLGDGAWMQSITLTADGYSAILSDDSGSRVVASTDGANWRTILVGGL